MNHEFIGLEHSEIDMNYDDEEVRAILKGLIG